MSCELIKEPLKYFFLRMISKAERNTLRVDFEKRKNDKTREHSDSLIHPLPFSLIIYLNRNTKTK